MAFLKVENVAIRGISGCVPSRVDENINLKCYSSKEEAAEVIKATGIERRHVTAPETTASDLCLKAAEKIDRIFRLGKRNYRIIGILHPEPRLRKSS